MLVTASIFRSGFGVFMLLLWIAGVVIAKGFWSTFFAVVVPFWGWYLSVEQFLLYFDVISG